MLLILHESAVGYALMEVTEAEEIGMTADSVQESVQDLARFGKICKLKSFVPFQSAEDALENINSLSEGIMHQRLKVFLEAQLPKGKKVQLGVADVRIGQVIKETLKCDCTHVGVVPELLRGIRMHFPKMLKGVSGHGVVVEKAQLGLGHSYSRAKVKFNVHRADNMIIQAISLLDQLDKDINTFSMRIREWYSYHFPELVRIVNDNHLFAQCALFIGRRTTLTDDSVEKLEQIVQDSTKAQQILEASRSSMGMDISDIDLISVNHFAKRVVGLADFRKGLYEYLVSKMHNVAPNLAGLIGEQVGARLISHAGSLTNLAKYPASTVQILGAEKALFRALKTKSNTPKYGIIFHSTFIGRAGAKNKGRISRFLANKCSIASRIDCFSENASEKFGEELKKQVEERLTFYETGEAPRKNIDVMKSVINDIGTPSAGSKRKNGDEEDGATSEKKKKKDKKKDKKAEEADEEEEEAPMAVTPKSEKKKDKKKDAEATSEKKKKKKEKKADSDSE